MESDQPLVFVVDDDASVRESILGLLRSIGQAAQAFASPEDFMRPERPDVPGCLVLDVRLPGESGLELQQRLKAAGLDLPIVFITGHGDIPMSVAAMKAGAVEFLTKPFRDQDLLDAVQRGLTLDRERRAALAGRAELEARFRSLTPREREVMALVAAGEPSKRIAATLGVSEVTVKVHRGHIMQKMQARSLPELVRFADRLGEGIRADRASDTKV